MKDLLRQARPDRFEDLIALVALYRPGPMDLIPDFNRRKHGLERVEYLDPRLEPILGTTYGIMVYQEQVMQIAQVLGGYSLGAADLLRRAMGKKKPEEMAEHREIFVKGAVERGVPEKKAEHLFDLMEKFAGYGFNKSHAAAYALVAYQTAWLKVHHPAAFIAATLSSDMDDTDKVHNFHEDAVANGLAILPPDINTGGYRFEPVSDREIRYGLGAVKGTGESAIGEILHARGSGPFSDLFDFCRRVDRRIVNRRVVEALIRAGAFDSLMGGEAEERAGRRASLLASVGAALEAADRLSASSHQDSLFGDAVSQTVSHVLVSVPDWSRREQLAQEKQALGFYFSGHPFSAYAKEIQGMVRRPLAQIAPSPELQLLAGVIAAVRTQMTRRGKMAFVMLDDNTARVEVAVFNELFERRREWLKEDALLLVQGKVSDDAYTGGMRVTADEVMNLDAARTRLAREMRLSCNGGSEAPMLKSMLSPYRSEEGCPIRLAYVNGRALCEIALGDAWRVRLDEPLLNALRDWLSPEKVEIRYQ
jgi:DNA polymerase-3 subunit alpha